MSVALQSSFGSAHRARLRPSAWVLSSVCCAISLRPRIAFPFTKPGQHVGETKCVSGKVLRIKVGAKGVHFLDFCEDQMACPFTVVVFASALKDVGDVRHFEGRTIEIHGAVKLYDGRPEIILNRISQISGGAAMIPPLPKNYDVENRGHFSAGRLSPTKKPGKTKAKVNSTSTYGNDVEGDGPRKLRPTESIY